MDEDKVDAGGAEGVMPEPGGGPEPGAKSESQAKRLRTQRKGSREETLRRALKNVLDNTPPDATPTSVRRQAEAVLKG